MTPDPEHVWRQPTTVGGQDIRLRSGGSGSSLSSSAKARLRRIVDKTPEVMIKVTGRSRGDVSRLKAHLDYITRNGRLAAETQDGRKIDDRASLRALHDDWLLANAAESRGRSLPNAAHSVAIILSMPPGTPPDRLEDAVRTWARETFPGTHDWLMARHDDTDHPHVHVTVRAVGADGRRLAPGPADLQIWRERFARELRRLGVEAEATPRQARGTVRKSPSMAIFKAERRGEVPRVRAAERALATREAESQSPLPLHDWSRDIQSRQEAIRRSYLAHADSLSLGDHEERRLARDIKRFVADMPVPLPRRQAMALELRQVLARHPGRVSESPQSQLPQTEQSPTPQIGTVPPKLDR